MTTAQMAESARLRQLELLDLARTSAAAIARLQALLPAPLPSPPKENDHAQDANQRRPL